MEPVAPERRQGGDDQGGVAVDLGGFTFRLDSATRVEAPTPALDAQAALQQVPAAELLAATKESEERLATLEETYDELIRYSMNADTTQRSRSVPPVNGHANDGSLDAGPARRPSDRRTVYAVQRTNGQGGSPEAPGMSGPVIDALHDFRAHHGFAPAHRPTPEYPGNRRHAADLVHDDDHHQFVQSDGKYGDRPGWPHHSVGVPGTTGGAYRPTPEYPGNRRRAADLVQDDTQHQFVQSDGNYGGRPGWPHRSVGVPGPAGGANRPTTASTGNGRHATDLVHDDNHHQQQSDMQYRERHGWHAHVALQEYGVRQGVVHEYPAPESPGYSRHAAHLVHGDGHRRRGSEPHGEWPGWSNNSLGIPDTAGGTLWPARGHPANGGAGVRRGPDYLTGDAMPMQSPVLTPIAPLARNSSMRHVEFLEEAIRTELAGNRDPVVLDTLLRQLDEANRALNGVPTPTKDGSTPSRDVHGSPEYKTCDQSVLDAQAAKENQRDMNDAISNMADAFDDAHKAIRLKVDSPLSETMDLLDRVVKWFAQAIPAGPMLAEYLRRAIPLRPCEVSPSVIHELKSGKEPTYCAVQRELEGLSVAGAPGGSGDAYMKHLDECRKYVSAKVVKDTNYTALNKAVIKSVRKCCDQQLLASLGAVSNCVDLCVMLAANMGRDQKAILLEVYGSLVAPIRMPRVGKGCTQPQEMLLFMSAAFDARMNTAGLLGANSASLAYLKLLESMPEGTGDMGPPVADIKATFEENLTNGACTTREAVTASIEAILRSLGKKRWNGDLVPAAASQLSRDGVSRSAYSVEAGPESAAAPPPKAETGSAAAGPSGATKPVCRQWGSTKGCPFNAKECKFWHPNGKKSRKQNAESSGGDKFNTRDLTPVGQSHTPVEKEKGGVVPVDPKVAAAHERNKNPRLRYDPTSD